MRRKVEEAREESRVEREHVVPPVVPRTLGLDPRVAKRAPLAVRWRRIRSISGDLHREPRELPVETRELLHDEGVVSGNGRRDAMSLHTAPRPTKPTDVVPAVTSGRSFWPSAGSWPGALASGTVRFAGIDRDDRP
jgi:hypothetical protein